MNLCRSNGESHEVKSSDMGGELFPIYIDNGVYLAGICISGIFFCNFRADKVA